jgi:hypothetical protein
MRARVETAQQTTNSVLFSQFMNDRPELDDPSLERQDSDRSVTFTKLELVLFMFWGGEPLLIG